MRTGNIELKGITKRFGEKAVLNQFNLKLEPGTVTCLLGPSGVGKSTVMNLLSGLMEPDDGVVILPENTVVSCVFQEPRLLPWLTVSGNLNFALKDVLPHGELVSRIAELLKGVELWNDRNAWPGQLSGGMRQRVSLTRGMGMPCQLLLLDEPFKGLDPALKERIIHWCRLRWQEIGTTVLLITHDPSEARLLGNAIVDMKAAEVE